MGGIIAAGGLRLEKCGRQAFPVPLICMSANGGTSHEEPLEVKWYRLPWSQAAVRNERRKNDD
jgi:hypothetical protein